MAESHGGGGGGSRGGGGGGGGGQGGGENMAITEITEDELDGTEEGWYRDMFRQHYTEAVETVEAVTETHVMDWNV